jgi:hypothetical protein
MGDVGWGRECSVGHLVQHWIAGQGRGRAGQSGREYAVTRTSGQASACSVAPGVCNTWRKICYGTDRSSPSGVRESGLGSALPSLWGSNSLRLRRRGCLASLQSAPPCGGRPNDGRPRTDLPTVSTSQRPRTVGTTTSLPSSCIQLPSREPGEHVQVTTFKPWGRTQARRPFMGLQSLDESLPLACPPLGVMNFLLPLAGAGVAVTITSWGLLLFCGMP